MERTIVAQFESQRQAELAVERLVKQHGIPRTDVSLRAAGEANSSGVKAAGSDIESDHSGVEKRGSPELAGIIEVTVDCRGVQSVKVCRVLRAAGANRSSLSTGSVRKLLTPPSKSRSIGAGCAEMATPTS